jgi:aryl-alcohol dehydrogenase-like predicted oxidoreductase
MQYRRLGKSGLKVSEFGIGTNQFGGKVKQKDTSAILDAAIDAGVNFIDTADVYQAGRSEEAIGTALEGKRAKVLIATKVYNPVEPRGPNDQGSSRLHIMQGLEASLKRLKTDYVDLYQLHRWDEETPIEESMRALDDLIRAGKVRYIGASNFTAWQLAEANAVARVNGWTEFIAIQPHYHMLERAIEAELLPASAYFNIGVLPYFPLAGGFLTGKYQEGKAAPSGSRGESSPYVQKYMTPQNYELLDKLATFAESHKRTINDLAHAWLLAQPPVSTVISGATSVDQVLSNISAHDWELSEEDLLTVNKLLEDSASSE